ncbi:MAG TPA: phosphopyruvate hydratase [Patescibacteria group bacterium]|nr:phosphopyruvate hydratase [Patescibacteria group bacterium]
MAKIKDIKAQEILNGKGEPAIETTVLLSDGKFGVSSCPTGTTVGSYEAVELRDIEEQRFQGRGVRKAIQNVTELIRPALLEMEATKQQDVDKKMIELDGTSNKSRLGANAILSVSMSVCKAAAQSSMLPLFLYLREFIKKDNLTLRVPTPIFNVLNGSTDQGADFKDFLILGATSKSYPENLSMISSINNALRTNLQKANLSTLISDEGAFSPNVSNNDHALELVKQSIESVSLRLGFDVFAGVDVVANDFFKQGKYTIKDTAIPLSSGELVRFYEEIAKKYSVIYFEDPLSDEDWEGWIEMTKSISSQALVVGDTLTATNPYRLQTALGKKAITGIVVKPVQIGTVIEALAVVEVARAAGLKIVASTRSEETNDDFIADFAVAVSSDYVKFGGIVRGEMVAKYNRLLQIETQLKTL